MDMCESPINLGFFGNKKIKIPNFDKKTPQDFGKKSSVGDTDKHRRR